MNNRDYSGVVKGFTARITVALCTGPPRKDAGWPGPAGGAAKRSKTTIAVVQVSVGESEGFWTRMTTRVCSVPIYKGLLMDEQHGLT